MKLRQMGDSSAAPTEATGLPVYAFYLFGQTPHVYTTEEVADLDARWGLPIAVNVNPAGPAEEDADGYAAILAKYGIGRGVTVALDTEDQVQASYIPRFDERMQLHGYKVLHYESRAVDGTNPPTSGGKWVAQWPGLQDLPDGAVANQYASAEQAGKPWDCSVISADVVLHELNPLVRPVFIGQDVTVQLPELRYGDEGYSVRALQGLLLAAIPGADAAKLEDGDYGVYTQTCVSMWQHLYGLEPVDGVADSSVWASLLTRA